jgi:hypothetical protein
MLLQTALFMVTLSVSIAGPVSEETQPEQLPDALHSFDNVLSSLPSVLGASGDLAETEDATHVQDDVHVLGLQSAPDYAEQLKSIEDSILKTATAIGDA